LARTSSAQTDEREDLVHTEAVLREGTLHVAGQSSATCTLRPQLNSAVPKVDSVQPPHQLCKWVTALITSHTEGDGRLCFHPRRYVCEHLPGANSSPIVTKLCHRGRGD